MLLVVVSYWLVLMRFLCQTTSYFTWGGHEVNRVTHDKLKRPNWKSHQEYLKANLG
jgi:hypothetical protein